MRAPHLKQGSPSRVRGSSPTVREGMLSGGPIKSFGIPASEIAAAVSELGVAVTLPIEDYQ